MRLGLEPTIAVIPSDCAHYKIARARTAERYKACASEGRPGFISLNAAPVGSGLKMMKRNFQSGAPAIHPPLIRLSPNFYIVCV